jgi:hypothetical protein
VHIQTDCFVNGIDEYGQTEDGEEVEVNSTLPTSHINSVMHLLTTELNLAFGTNWELVWERSGDSIVLTHDEWYEY